MGIKKISILVAEMEKKHNLKLKDIPLIIIINAFFFMRSILDLPCLLCMRLGLGLGLVLVQGWMSLGEPPIITGEFAPKMCKQETKGSGRGWSFTGSGLLPRMSLQLGCRV